MKINNRRYIGSKNKLLDKIFELVEDTQIEYKSFADIFAGTGVVANRFADKSNIILNDNLYHNYIIYKAWFSSDQIDVEEYKKYIDLFNNTDYSSFEDNYFSEIYANKYFHKNDAIKIGFIRDEIEKIKDKISDRLYYLLISSLILYTDKIANTVGHFEHFLSSSPKETTAKLKMLDAVIFKNVIDIYNEDANDLIKKIKADIVYIDPPYNARQYVNFYHVLENLARWEKPQEFEGISMKFKRNNLKSKYSTVKATETFRDLVENCVSKLIVVSYNNTYNASSTASNNKITFEEITNILQSKGNLEVHEVNHKFFNSGKTNFKQHKELLFICKVKNEK